MNMKSAMSRNALPSGAPAARVPVGIRSRMSVMPRAVGLADLESVLRTSEVLKLQIEKERARSREITRELDANGRNYNDAGYRQAEQIRKQRIQAQDACLEAVMALEGEKRRIENILAESGSSSDVVESERRARACAEKVAMELEAKIRAASSALAAASQGVSSSGSGSASSELGQAEDAMEAAQRLHTIMKQQLTGEIKRGADAKELASKRARELKQTAEKLRDLEKTRKMLYSQIDDLAKQASAEPGPSAPSSSGAPVSATEKDLLIAAKKISQRVADAERRKEGFQHTKELLAKQNDIFKNVMSDASKLDSITSSLDRLMQENESLRKQVIAEGQKASAANRDLASFTNHIKNQRQNRELLQQEMALKEKALSATESVKRAIQDEKMNHERIIREAGPALQMLETARTSETKVVALADELDNKLRAAKDRLEKQRNAPAAPVRASPAPAASSSSYSGGAYEAQLAEAETTISMLTKRVAAECARVGHAKDLALTIQKDLGQASGKLRDCEYRLKMMSKAAKNAIIAAEEGQRQLSAFSASSSAPSSSAPSQADPALVQKVQEQTRLADELEAEVQSLEQEIHGLKAGAAAIARNVDTSSMRGEEAEYHEIQNHLNHLYYDSEELKKAVLTEGKRANTVARELYSSHNRVKEVESTMQMLRNEVSNMKNAMVGLDSQLRDVLASKTQKQAEREEQKEASLRALEKDLQLSRSQVGVVKTESAKIASELEESSQRVANLEDSLKSHFQAKAMH